GEVVVGPGGPRLIREAQRAGTSPGLAGGPDHGFVPNGQTGGVVAVPAHLAGGDEVAPVGGPRRQPVAVDEQIEGRGKDEILRRRRDQGIAFPHAALLVARIARRAVEQHTAGRAPVGTEPAVEVVQDYRARGGRGG